MSMRIKKMFLLQLVLVAIEVLLVSSQTVDITREGCQDKCGNVSIPYPFGTRKGCYYDKDFLITCNSTSYNPPKPFLRESDIEVTNISIDGKLYITQDIAMACYYRSGVPWEGNYSPYLSLKKFYISDTDNKFIGVGCDTYAEIRGFQGTSHEYTGGCFSKCYSTAFFSNDSCSGIGCCQTPIAKGMTYFDISVSSYENQTKVWNFNPCSYAFLVQEGKFNFTSDMLSDLRNISQFPVVLDWSIGDETCSQIKKNVCKGNSKCLAVENGLGYRCKCNEGYEGNPYLNGCTDINECEDPVIAKKCKQKCINTEGNYTCACHKGYHNNGTADSVDCIADQKFVQIIVGLGVGLISLLISSSWLYLVYKRWRLMKLKEKFFIQNGGLLLKQQLSERQGGATNQTTKIFTEDQLKKATNHFSEARIVGKGGFGTVYKGIIADERAKETVVAIKKSKLVDRSQIEQFINEVLVLSQINHRNVVKLLGCCFETEVPLLVYEFVTNGTLFDYIHNKSKASKFAWETRLRIAAEAAGVLSYLHSAASVPIIHRDVKSTNILLDETLTAKVSDFGASRLVPLDQAELSTMVQGTLGYLDPEYLQTSQLTDKSDVYSFGVVLVELLTGKKALSFDRQEEDRNLAMYFLSALKENRLVQVVDECVLNGVNDEQLKEVSNLAKRCLKVKGEERPTMMEVASELEGLRRMAMHHPWVNNDEYNARENESLLGEISLETFSHGGGGDTSSGYDTMRTHIILPVNDGR